MGKRKSFFTILLLLIIICIVLIVLSRFAFFSGVTSFFENIFSPVGQRVYSVFHKGESETDLNTIETVNKIVDYQKLSKEAFALRDQYETSVKDQMQLLPSFIVGSPSFVPGVSVPEQFVIDKGKRDGVVLGQAVIYKDNVIGKITKVTPSMSLVSLVSNKSFSITAKTSRNGALGVIRGMGNGEIVFDNILPSEDIKPGDIVVSYGDLSLEGLGIPPDLVIGKISSIDKKPSALFQTANLESLVNFSSLSLVFVVVSSN